MTLLRTNKLAGLVQIYCYHVQATFHINCVTLSNGYAPLSGLSGLDLCHADRDLEYEGGERGGVHINSKLILEQ